MIFANTYAQSQDIVLSPLKQIKSGTMIQDIKCKENFVLVIKESNEHPACVKPTSITKLLSRGWVTLEKFEISHPIINQYNKTNNLIFPKQNFTNNNSVNKTAITIYPKIISLINVTKSSSTNTTGSEISVSPGITTPTISSTKPGIQIIAIEMSPDPLKVGDRPQFTITFKNISDKVISHVTGCRASSLGYTLSPTDNVQEEPSAPVTCAQYVESIQPNGTAANYGRSYHLNGSYIIVKPGTLDVTMHLLLQKDDPLGLDLIETIQFNVNATQ